MEETGILDSYEEYVSDLNAQINNLKSKVETMQTQIEINDSNFKTQWEAMIGQYQKLKEETLHKQGLLIIEQERVDEVLQMNLQHKEIWEKQLMNLEDTVGFQR